MIEVYVIVGAGGVLGSQISNDLRKFDVPIVRVSAAHLTSLNDQAFSEAINGLVNEIKLVRPNAERVGLVLAHRYRGTDIPLALRNELCITRDFIWCLSKNFSRLHAVVVGSATGRYIDSASSDAYHFAKDLQKSIVRRSVTLPNVAMNLLELSWFEKHPISVATPEYRKKIEDLRTLLGDNNVPAPSNIAEFIRQLLDCALPPRGQSITYDGGYDLFQR